MWRLVEKHSAMFYLVCGYDLWLFRVGWRWLATDFAIVIVRHDVNKSRRLRRQQWRTSIEHVACAPTPTPHLTTIKLRPDCNFFKNKVQPVFTRSHYHEILNRKWVPFPVSHGFSYYRYEALYPLRYLPVHISTRNCHANEICSSRCCRCRKVSLILLKLTFILSLSCRML